MAEGTFDYGKKSEEKIQVDKFVCEMGFNSVEANMALQDTNGNIDQAIEKLLAGKYAPPPYSPSQVHSVSVNIESGSKDSPSIIPKFISNITNRHKSEVPKYEENPTAPSMFEIGKDEGPPNFSDILMPPPYEKIEKTDKILSWERDANVKHLNYINNISSDIAFWSKERCSVCFSELFKGYGDGADVAKMLMRENLVQQHAKIYHYECFTKKFAPKCAYCCFSLTQPDKDHDLSGKYLIYKNKDYHVECYEKYAGPRCTYCFNVIIEKPNGEYSGEFIIDGTQEFHAECYQKKMYATWRAKNS